MQTIFKVVKQPFRWVKLLISENWRGSALGLFLGTLFFIGLVGWKTTLGFHSTLNLLFILLVGGVMLLLTVALVDLLRLILTCGPRLLVTVVIGSSVFIGIFIHMISNSLPIAIGIGFVYSLIQVFFGGSIYALYRGGMKQLFPVCILVITMSLNIWGFVWLFDSGSEVIVVTETLPDLAQLDLPNPGNPGDYQVRMLTYGSGVDKRRVEYREDVDRVTASVDGSKFHPTVTGLEALYRNWFWGFRANELPINGRVWYPEGEGPFPLIVIVHGNHAMEEFSDPGYEYLGKLFASRGLITVSVDQNFLNGFAFGNINGEMDLRGWLLLEHLQVLRDWNDDAESRLYQKVDFDRIALVGHSRGGEAALVATAFNQLGHYPDDATIRFDYGFGIQSVVALAPIDGLYQPANQVLPIENVNYLVIQGSHDSDVFTFYGSDAYQRVQFTDDHDRFKASLYIYRANHGQFNTEWGRDDLGGIAGLFLNTSEIMPGSEQRQILEVVLSGFFEATLFNRYEYVPMFRDIRVASRWLPDTIFIQRYADSRYQVLADFSEDIDVRTMTVPGGLIYGENLQIWREQKMRYRQGRHRAISAVYLGWDNPKASYRLVLPDDIRLQEDSTLVLALASDDGHTPDFSVELVAFDGASVKLPLSEFLPIRASLPAAFTKLRMIDRIRYGSATEAVLQDHRLPMAKFLATDPSLSLEYVREIRLVFDRSPRGLVILGEVGYQ